MTAAVIGIVLTIISTILGSIGSLFLKKGSKDLHRNLLQQWRNGPLVKGVVVFVTGVIIYIIALKFGDLSILFPITSLKIGRAHV